MKKIITRIFLVLAMTMAIVAIVFSSIAIKKPTDPALATMAATLAVITSIISAWGALRVVELEEDKLRPYPILHFDTKSRYGLMLLRVYNSGNGVAHDIHIQWDKPLINSEGKEINFSPDRASHEIPVLLPGQSVSTQVDGYIQLYKMDKKHEYSGHITYKDSCGKKLKNKFILDGEMFRGTPYAEEESLKTHHELQKLPEKIENLSKEVRGILELLSGKSSEWPSQDTVYENPEKPKMPPGI